jgi:hypothetical protein
MELKEIKLQIIEAGEKAVMELIKVASDQILKPIDDGTDLAADKLKNAASAKKLAIFDAFEILNRIESEREKLNEDPKEAAKPEPKIQGFAEKRSK